MRVANDILIPELARLLNENKEVRFTPSGVSMRPFIEGDRDSVILAPVTGKPVRGNILLAQTGTPAGQNIYVLHRLVRTEKNAAGEELYILQGDGNLQGEESCLRSGIMGRVIAVETPGGRRKHLTNGRLWHALLPVRRYLLKIYRHTWLKWYYR